MKRLLGIITLLFIGTTIYGIVTENKILLCILFGSLAIIGTTIVIIKAIKDIIDND